MTLGASRATGTQCPGRLVIKTAAQQIDVIPCRLYRRKDPISLDSVFSQFKKKKKKPISKLVSPRIPSASRNDSGLGTKFRATSRSLFSIGDVFLPTFFFFVFSFSLFFFPEPEKLILLLLVTPETQPGSFDVIFSV